MCIFVGYSILEVMKFIVKEIVKGKWFCSLIVEAENTLEAHRIGRLSKESETVVELIK